MVSRTNTQQQIIDMFNLQQMLHGRMRISQTVNYDLPTAPAGEIKLLIEVPDSSALASAGDADRERVDTITQGFEQHSLSNWDDMNQGQFSTSEKPSFLHDGSFIHVNKAGVEKLVAQGVLNDSNLCAAFGISPSHRHR